MKRNLTVLACLALTACLPKTPQTPSYLPYASAAGSEAVKSLPPPYNRGDPAAGRDAFTPCSMCHSLDPNGSEEKGPILYGVLGKPAASRPDYAYSEAMRAAGYVWDVRHLDHWIFNPHEAMPGTSMVFIGVRNDKKRYDLIAYLAAIPAS